MKQKMICVLLMILGCSGVLCAAQKGQEFYQQALVEERAVGNLEKAIELFQRAAKESRGDRELAAKALLAAARCYEKLGQAKATELYEEVAGTYPEQRELATEARERLATLRRASAPGETATNALAEDIRATLRVDLRRIETLVQQLAQPNVRSSELDDLRAQFQSIQNELQDLKVQEIAQEIAREKLQTRNQTSANLAEMEALRAKLAEQSAMWSNTLDKVAQSLAASEFDTNKPITFTGAMKGIETRLDQRVYVHVESKAANGSAITYRVLLGKANLLADTDQVTDLAKTFNPGDVLTVEGHRSKDPTSLDVGNATITRPDGRRIKLSN